MWPLVSLWCFPTLELEFMEELYLGMKKACEFYRCEVVGGNVSKGEKLCIDVFMLGKRAGL
ncbi:MAG: AIR synthase related protein [Aquificaceae bacterium]